MSITTRIMMGLPLPQGMKYQKKVIGNLTFIRGTEKRGTALNGQPVYNAETCIVRKTPAGRELLKSVFTNEKKSVVMRTGQQPITVDKVSGRVFNANV